ncbi:MAG: MucR family transcriptional regulator [Alphaproteobacteria bacterium]|nr:MucR family transcriptional regulator [Alphaproteobacteria bacterium]
MLKLTARVVTGYLAGNKVAMSDLPGLIRVVHQALTEAGQEPAVVEGPVPAVPIRKSVAVGHVVCLDCGRKMTMLRRHIALNHGLAPAEYRAKWGLSPDHPLVAPEYAEKRSALALAR